MKLFVDDIRKLPDESWYPARTVSEAIRAINMFDFKVISLDHDIEGSKETFDTVALYIVEKYKNAERTNGSSNISKVLRFIRKTLHKEKPKIVLHTANPAGARRMARILEKFDVSIKELGFN